MPEHTFNELYKRLNPEQREAVDAVEGPVMVIAGPGTGKTSILTLRIANILRKTDTAPDSILALTFTESGVHQMRKKLVDIIGPAGYRVHIHTFHSFCNEIIKHFSQEFPRIIGAQHMTDIDQIRILEEIITTAKLSHLRPYGNPFFYLRPILSEIKNLKREDIDPTELSVIIKKQEETFAAIPDLVHEKGKYKGEIKGAYKTLQKKIENNKELLVVYKKYQEALEKEHLYDYEDMIMEVIRELETNRDLLLELQETYQYVLADEHQDANNAQNKLLEHISGFHENPNLFIVGDEKQAIFRFQGASLENFLYFKKRFPEAKLISLTQNYRSSQNILDASFDLISKNRSTSKELRVELKANRDGVFPTIKLCEVSTPRIEHEYIAAHIKERIEAGTPASSIAVLYRDNGDSVALASVLDAHGVAYVVHSDADLFADADIKKFMLLLNAVNDFGNDEILSRLFFIDFLGLHHLDVYKVLRGAFNERIALYDVIKSKEILTRLGVENSELFISLYGRLHKLAVYAKNNPLLAVFEEVSREFSITEHLLGCADAVSKFEVFDTLLSQVTALVERHKSYMLSDYIHFLQKTEEHGIFTKIKGGAGGANKVHLMTAHKSKGLEFDFVYCIGLTDKHWGNRRSPTYFNIGMFGADVEDHHVEDERRLLYVAITRARNEVVLSYARYNESGKELLPSQYISEIDATYISRIDTAEFEAAYATGKNRLTQAGTEKAPMLDATYFRELFLEQGLSVSALNNYLRCPWSFVFLNLLRLPKAQERHQLYGTAIHETLKVFFDAYREEKDIPKKKFLEIFKNFLNRKALSLQDFNELFEKGTEALSGYYDTYKGTWHRTIINEMSIAGVFLPLDEVSPDGATVSLLLKGSLDKVEIAPDESVTVVDYKTGAPKSRAHIEGAIQSSDGDYKRQLVFYKILLDRFNNGAFSMRAGEIDFIEPDEKGHYKKERFDITASAASELEAEIKRVAGEIINASFWNTTCEDRTCEYCKLSAHLKKLT